MSQNRPNGQAVLTIEDLRVQFSTYEGTARAVDTVSLDVRHGETLGLVGESGCGKSVTALSIMRLLPTPPARIADGRIYFRQRTADGADAGVVDLLSLPAAAMCRVRGNDISMIFQEPMTSLNPVFTIGSQIEEVLRQHRGLSPSDARLEAIRMLERVRIPDPIGRVDAYPHQLSGGMRQRAMIAIALACNPALLLADEPTTALDVTVQAQILALMDDLKTQRGSSVILITHDLGVIAEVAARVCVMYAGELVEVQPVQPLFENPLHPYTQALFRSIPARQARQKRLYVIPGQVPSATALPPACRFAARCSERFALCDQAHPPLATRPDGARVRCFLYEECRAALETAPAGTSADGTPD